MKILDELISSINEDSVVREVRVCVFWTAVLSKNCGLASTLNEGHPHHKKVRDPGKLKGKSALKLAEYAKSNSLLEASIGMAAINSLIEIDESRCVEKNAFHILAEKGMDRDIAVVGHFPWIPELKKIARRLFVIEQRPQQGDFPAEASEEILPKVDVVGITGTAFTNHTIETLLKLSAGKFIVVLGPTSPLSPVLFDYGVDVIGGSKVVDPEKTIRSISEGATFRQVEGVRYLNMLRDGINRGPA
ncbi:MAG TPA: DUF364 domain-containing protein [Desulfatiglandales bacterium]|nr:DUF364 domain-containing protein [Desulfatiglandales bacterium]